jgi:hypothetical protein
MCFIAWDLAVGVPMFVCLFVGAVKIFALFWPYEHRPALYAFVGSFMLSSSISPLNSPTIGHIS